MKGLRNAAEPGEPAGAAPLPVPEPGAAGACAGAGEGSAVPGCSSLESDALMAAE